MLLFWVFLKMFLIVWIVFLVILLFCGYFGDDVVCWKLYFLVNCWNLWFVNLGLLLLMNFLGIFCCVKCCFSMLIIVVVFLFGKWFILMNFEKKLIVMRYFVFLKNIMFVVIFCYGYFGILCDIIGFFCW